MNCCAARMRPGSPALRHAQAEARPAPARRLALRASPAVIAALQADPAALAEPCTDHSTYPLVLRSDPALRGTMA